MIMTTAKMLPNDRESRWYRAQVIKRLGGEESK